MTIKAGKATLLTKDGIELSARLLGVSTAEVMAILEVETAGVGFLIDRRPIILFERHIFSRRTGGIFDTKCPDLSNPKPSGYGAGGLFQYERLEKAMEYHREAALYSASWGLGQIMGFNYARAGYQSVDQMIESFADGENNQVLAIAAFIRRSGLSDELIRHDWTSFAYGYNGPGFATHNYDRRLKVAYEKWSRCDPMNCVLRSFQLQLKWDNFYAGKVDGIDGPLTRSAIRRAEQAGWFREHGISDGCIP